MALSALVGKRWAYGVSVFWVQPQITKPQRTRRTRALVSHSDEVEQLITILCTLYYHSYGSIHFAKLTFLCHNICVEHARRVSRVMGWRRYHTVSCNIIRYIHVQWRPVNILYNIIYRECTRKVFFAFCAFFHLWRAIITAYICMHLCHMCGARVSRAGIVSHTNTRTHNSRHLICFVADLHAYVDVALLSAGSMRVRVVFQYTKVSTAEPRERVRACTLQPPHT